MSTQRVKLGELPIKIISKVTANNGIQKTDKVVKFAIGDGMKLNLIILRITIRRENFEMNSIILLLSFFIYIGMTSIIEEIAKPATNSYLCNNYNLTSD